MPQWYQALAAEGTHGALHLYRQRGGNILWRTCTVARRDHMLQVRVVTAAIVHHLGLLYLCCCCVIYAGSFSADNA